MTTCRSCGLASMHGKARHKADCPFHIPAGTVEDVLAEHPDFIAWNDAADDGFPEAVWLPPTSETT